MSGTIDERVVSMQFDNKQFESNVQTSLGTLEKLKQSLNFTGASKGLESVDAAAKSINFSPLHNAVETVGAKFSAMQVMAVTALANITNSAVNAGKRIAESLTIEPIKTGFNEYELKMNSVQTIMAGSGESLDTVNRYLNELNEYSDKTIYSFQDMTSNIGKFTNAGVKLEDAVAAIQGISNVAAVSGANTNEASRAMYNFAQALSSGYVKLIDWKSIELANMATVEFKDHLLEAAVSAGTLTKESDGMYKTLGGKTLNATKNFNDSLQDEWMTTEVLVSTLRKYSDETTEIGKKATAAAQDVKTFSQLMDTLKESAQSGWAQTWEILVGDIDEAKKLWTSVSEVIGGALGRSAESRNNLLDGALTSNWDKMIEKINEAGVETETFEEKVKEVAKGQDVNVEAMIKKYGSLEEAFKSGAISSDILKEAVSKLNTSLVDLEGVEAGLKFGAKGDDVKKVQEALKNLKYDIGEADIDGILGKDTEAAIKAFQEAQGLEITGIIDDETLTALEKASSATANLTESVGGLIDGVTKLGGRELIIESLANIFHGLMAPLNMIKAAFREVFPPMTSEQLYKLIEGFKNLTEKFRLTAPQLDNVKQTFKGIFSVIDISITFVKELVKGIAGLLGNFSGLGSGILEATGSFGEWLSGIRDSAKETNLFGTIVGGITGVLQLVIDKVKQFCSAIGEKIKAPGFEGIVSLFKGLWDVIKTIGSKIGAIIAGIGRGLGQAFQNGDIDGAISILNGGLFTGILLNFKKLLSGGFSDLFDAPKGMLESISEALGSVKGALESWQQDLQANTLLKLAGAIGILALSLILIASMDPERLAASLGAVTMLFADLMGSMAIFTKISGSGMRGIGKAALAMIGMATAILILSFALKSLSSLSWEDMLRGIVGISAMLAAMTIALNKLPKKSFSKGKSSIFGESSQLMSSAMAMIGMAAAMKILASACKDFASMSWEELARGLVAVGVLLTELLLATKFMGNSKGLISTGLALVVMASAMKILASVMRDFSGMNWDEVGRGLAGMAGAMAIMVIAMNKLPKKSFSKGKSSIFGESSQLLSSAVAMIGMAAAMKILASAVQDFSSMSWEDLGKGLLAMAVALGAVTIAVNFMPRNMISIGFGLAIVAGALHILSSAVKEMGGMSYDEIGRSIMALGSSLLILTFALQAMNGTIAGSFALLIAAGALMVLAPALKMLGSMSVGQIAKALLALAGAFVILGVAGVTLGLIAPLLIALAGALALIGVSVLAVGVGIMALAAGFTTLAGAGAVGAYAFIETLKIIVTGIIGLIPAIAGAIGEAIVTICLVIAESAPALGEAIKAVVLTLIDVLVECVPQLADGALTLIVEILAALVEYTPTIVNSLFQLLIGLLDGISANLPALIESGLGIFSAFVTGIIDGLSGVFESLGNALGSVIGSIINGLLEGISESLPTVGTNLSTFMTNLGPFIEGVQGLDESTMTGITTIVGMITELTKAGLMDSIATFISGESSLTQFAQDIVPFGIAMKAFSIVVKGLDENAVTAAANAGKMLSGMVETIPKSGGVVGFFTGERDIAGFAAGIVPFGTAIKAFADEVTGIDEGAVTAAATAGSAMASMVETIPNTGGVVQFFAGEHDMEKFSAGLVPFGTAIKKFSAEVTGIDESAITAAANAGTALSEMANTLPETGGIWQWFSGEQNMETFGNQLVKFGSGVKSFSEEVTGIDTDAVTAAAGVGTTMTTLANSITDGAIDNLAYFGGSMASFGSYLAQFDANIADIDNARLSASISQAYRLASMAKTFDGVDFTGLGSLGDSLTKIGKAGIDGFIAAFEDASERVNKAGSAMITNFLNGASEKAETITKSFKTLADTAVTAIRDKWQRFYNAGKYVVDGFASGIKANGYKARDEAEAIAEDVEQTIKDALKINSPSKVMIPIGGGVPEGLAVGMNKFGGLVKKSAVSVASMAIEGTKNAIGRIADVVNSDIDAQPTIRPVLDLSEVTAGAGAINGMFGMTPSVGVMANLGSISSSMNGRQNGANDDVITAIKTLGKQLGGMRGDTYTINGVTYDDGSNVSEAVKSLVRAAKVERRR